jgi:RNA polymerase sigma-70 factor (ECF subfamily)
LPAREREGLLLSVVKELSTVEIARVLQTTDSTIRSQLYLARKALQLLVGAGWELDPMNGFRKAEE